MRFPALLVLLASPTALASAAAPVPNRGPARELAYCEVVNNKWQIHVIDAVTGEKKQLSDNTASDVYPTWSPDGKHIAFVSNRKGNQQQLWTMKADGTGAQPVGTWRQCARPPQWSPDGSRIAF